MLFLVLMKTELHNWNSRLIKYDLSELFILGITGVVQIDETGTRTSAFTIHNVVNDGYHEVAHGNSRLVH